MDGIRNFWHTPYYVDLVNKGSMATPDFGIAVDPNFKHPDEFRHRFVPDSPEGYVGMVGKKIYIIMKYIILK